MRFVIRSLLPIKLHKQAYLNETHDIMEQIKRNSMVKNHEKLKQIKSCQAITMALFFKLVLNLECLFVSNLRNCILRNSLPYTKFLSIVF